MVALILTVIFACAGDIESVVNSVRAVVTDRAAVRNGVAECELPVKLESTAATEGAVASDRMTWSERAARLESIARSERVGKENCGVVGERAVIGDSARDIEQAAAGKRSAPPEQDVMPESADLVDRAISTASVARSEQAVPPVSTVRSQRVEDPERNVKTERAVAHERTKDHERAVGAESAWRVERVDTYASTADLELAVTPESSIVAKRAVVSQRIELRERAEVGESAALFVRGRKTNTCGVERNPIKHDEDVQPCRGGEGLGSCILMNPMQVNVAYLAQIPKPDPPVTSDDLRGIGPEEYQVYDITAVVIVAKHESDQDIHLGLEDPDDFQSTMIAESVDPDCAPNSYVSGWIAGARRSILAAIGGTLTTQALRTLIGKKVHITGIGFFDKLHGQSAVAPNGIELHPILTFEVVK